MTLSYEPKISNFHFSRRHNDPTLDIKIISEVVRWMAPEKMQRYKYSASTEVDAKLFPYTQKCEIFSFGMLLWEMAYQVIPYKNENNIIDKVTSGFRENCLVFENLGEEDKLIQDNIITIINKAWRHDPSERVEVTELYLNVTDLSKAVIPKRCPVFLPAYKPQESFETRINQELDKYYLTEESFEEFEQILP
ncbi:16035_t:CDS:2, partial [Acaulospora colombiana]